MPENLYEAMFVVDAAKGGAEFANVVRHIANLLNRVEAEIVRIEKWGERKLAYRMKRAKRGIYILVYFRAGSSAVSELRHDVRLSEEILRVLVLRAEEQNPVSGELYNPEGELLEDPSAGARPARAAEPPDEDEGDEDEDADEEEAEEEEGDEELAVAGEADEDE